MLINHDKLTEITEKILHATGVSKNRAHLVSVHLVDANLKGHDSHGVILVHYYVSGIIDKLVFPNRHVELKRDNDTVLSFDGRFGLGRIVGMEAIEQGIERAHKTRICCVALGNAAHLGRIGIFGERCAEDGFISIHFVNAVGHDPMVVAFGGRDRRFVTNPFCCSVPRPDGNHIVLDMATSTVAAGKVRLALMKGLQTPDDSLIDDLGAPTNDPSIIETIFNGGGAMLPFGKHKGYGIMVMCELLGGALGGLYTMQPNNPRKGHSINNMFSIIIDPNMVCGQPAFDDEVSAMIEYIYTSEPANGTNAVLLPGDPERRTKAQRLKEGIEIDKNTWSNLIRAGERVGMSVDKIARIVD